MSCLYSKSCFSDLNCVKLISILLLITLVKITDCVKVNRNNIQMVPSTTDFFYKEIPFPSGSAYQNRIDSHKKTNLDWKKKYRKVLRRKPGMRRKGDKENETKGHEGWRNTSTISWSATINEGDMDSVDKLLATMGPMLFPIPFLLWVLPFLIPVLPLTWLFTILQGSGTTLTVGQFG